MAKSDVPAQPLTLKCSECDHENEPQRVFCHNCGAKLDRSILPRGEDVFNPHQVSLDSKKRVAEMMNTNRGWFGRLVKTAFKVVALAVPVAAAYLIIQAPPDVPPMKSEVFPDTDAQMVWGDAMNSPTPATDILREDALNVYCKKLMKPGETFPMLGFKRVYCKLQPTFMEVTAHREAFGFPIYTAVGFQVKVDQGKVATQVVSMRIGRLAITPMADKLARWLLEDVRLAFDKKHGKQMARVTAFQHGKEFLAFSVKPE
jgi:hypothetical protein